MNGQILAAQVDKQTRIRTASLLKQKLGKSFQTVEDVVDILQLMLIADDGVGGSMRAGERHHHSADTVVKAADKVHDALMVLIRGQSAGVVGGAFGAFSYNPRAHLPEDANPRVEFYPLYQAILPLKSSSMVRQSDREQIILNLINRLKIHHPRLQRLFLGITDTHLRRERLKAYFRQQWQLVNQGQVLVNVLKYSATQVRHTEDPVNLMMGDLFAVFIGNDMLSGRLSGQYFGGNLNGSEGFARLFSDRHNQIQHAIAGLVIGYRMGIIGTSGASLVDGLKWEIQDVALYHATYYCARDLGENNYMDLSEKVRKEIMNDSVVPAR